MFTESTAIEASAAELKLRIFAVSAPPLNQTRMCLQPAELVLADADLTTPRRRPRRQIVDFNIRAYCRLCLGSGSTTRSVRAPSVSRRGGDGRDDGSGGDDGGDGPPGPPTIHTPLTWTPSASGRAEP
jgi:hypothetical protein